MRKLAAIVFLLFCAASSLYGQKARLGQVVEKPNPADYPITVHISATHIRHECPGTRDGVAGCDGLYAHTVLKGKKLELSGSAEIGPNHHALIAPGNYPARLTKDIQNADGSVIYQEYEILLPDGTVWKCKTSGISE
jgi:hypothetical protein